MKNKLAKLKYMPNNFKIIEEGDHVICAISKKKIPLETFKLLNIQRDAMIKQLTRYPNLYYAKTHFPLEISQQAFNHLWRICESYELWCKETAQNELIYLNVLD